MSIRSDGDSCSEVRRKLARYRAGREDRVLMYQTVAREAMTDVYTGNYVCDLDGNCILKTHDISNDGTIDQSIISSYKADNEILAPPQFVSTWE